MKSECFQNNEGEPVFLAHMDRLLAPAYLLTGSHEQAGECFLEACNNFAAEAGQDALTAAKRAVVRAALGRIARDVAKCAANQIRKDRPGVAKMTVIGAGQEEFQLDSKAFRDALLSLDAFQRAALVLRLYEKYSSEEASDLLQVPPLALESGWRCALLQLVDALNSARPAKTRPVSTSDTNHRRCCWQMARSTA